jgi:hypothetical protein
MLKHSFVTVVALFMQVGYMGSDVRAKVSQLTALSMPREKIFSSPVMRQRPSGECSSKVLQS